MFAVQAAAGSALTDVSREVRDKQRRQRAREQLLKLNQKRREETVRVPGGGEGGGCQGEGEQGCESGRREASEGVRGGKMCEVESVYSMVLIWT